MGPEEDATGVTLVARRGENDGEKASGTESGGGRMDSMLSGSTEGVPTDELPVASWELDGVEMEAEDEASSEAGSSQRDSPVVALT